MANAHYDHANETEVKHSSSKHSSRGEDETIDDFAKPEEAKRKLALDEWDLKIREQELEIKKEELQLKKDQASVPFWKSSLVISILLAAIAAGTNAWVAYRNGSSEHDLESQKAEQARILEMIKTGDPDKAAANLAFLLNAGLIKDPETRAQLQTYLSERAPGAGPVLPILDSPTPFTAPSPLTSKPSASLKLGALQREAATSFFRTTLTWTSNVRAALITETHPDGTETAISTSPSGSESIGGIGAKGQYSFVIYDVERGLKVKLSSVSFSIP